MRFLLVRVSVVARPMRISLASGSVYVREAVFVFVKKLVKVFATLRSQNIQLRNVLSPDTVWVDARTISPAHPVTFKVVPVIERFVPSVISSITPVPAVFLQRSLFVFMLSSFFVALRFAKFVFITEREFTGWSVQRIVVIALILWYYSWSINSCRKSSTPSIPSESERIPRNNRFIPCLIIKVSWSYSSCKCCCRYCSSRKSSHTKSIWELVSKSNKKNHSFRPFLFAKNKYFHIMDSIRWSW